MSLPKEETKACFAPKKRTLRRHAIRQLITFANKYFCETRFSNMHKQNKIQKLNGEPLLGNKLSSIKPDIKIIHEENKNLYPH
jgi:hypothetical protein